MRTRRCKKPLSRNTSYSARKHRNKERSTTSRKSRYLFLSDRVTARMYRDILPAYHQCVISHQSEQWFQLQCYLQIYGAFCFSCTGNCSSIYSTMSRIQDDTVCPGDHMLLRHYLRDFLRSKYHHQSDTDPHEIDRRPPLLHDHHPWILYATVSGARTYLTAPA